MAKARYTMQCGCGCRSDITVGQQFVRYASRPWKVQHLIEYKAKRNSLRVVR